MLKVELKRILKTRSTCWLLVIAFVLSILLAVLTINAQYTDAGMLRDYYGADYVRGFDAINMKKQRYEQIEEAVTPDKISGAYEAYHKVAGEYGNAHIPTDVYYEKIVPIMGIFYATSQVFYDADGAEKALDDITPSEAATFYSQRKKYISTVLSSKYSGHPEVVDYALTLDESVKEPFEYHYGIGDSDSAEYLTICTLMLAIICAVITAPMFSAEYANSSDDILRSTKKGKSRLALVKVISSLTVSIGLYILCVGVFAVITLAAFGLDSSSIQFGKSTLIFAPLTENSLLILLLVSGFLTVLAICSFSLFLSSKLNSPMLSLAISIGVALLPTIINLVGGGSNIINWIRLCLPSAGFGFGTNMFYELISGTFLWIGKMVVWSPYALLITAALELPIFSGLAVISYNKHELS